MRKILINGLIAGIAMGIGLFITGAIASRIIYGPQMVPEGKFEPDQINAFYFIWTKLAIGCFFGIAFTWIYSKLYKLIKYSGVLNGLVFSFLLWMIITLWSISHPLVYESVATKDQLFWNIYTLGGFLSYGLTIGGIFRK
jgi:Mn2+/Fe2+ NRAMP family transporter